MRAKKSTYARGKVLIGLEPDESEWSHHRVFSRESKVWKILQLMLVRLLLYPHVFAY